MRLTTLVIAILLFNPVFSIAQKGKGRQRVLDKQRFEANLKYFNDIFGQNDPDFENTKAPEKWSAEPVVLLCQKIHLSFLRNPDLEGSTTKGAVRKRILIQDKASLNNFSEFYYQEGLAVGIRHIKPDGTSRDIDLESAVKVETEIPRFYADSYHSDDYFKIAIPDLEVGDIIDYFKVFQQGYGTNIELITSISSTYPIVRQEIIFDIDKFWNFFYGSFNGAPEFTQDEEGGIDLKGRKRKIVKRFVMTDQDREAQKEERWDYNNLTEPIFKVMALPPNASLGNKSLKDVIKNNLSVKATFKPMIAKGKALIDNNTLPKSINKRLSNLGIKKMGKTEKINTIYNVIRYEFLTQNIAYQALRTGKPVGAKAADKYYSMVSHVFAALFSDILQDNDVDAKVVVVVPRYFGNVETVVTVSEMEFGVYVPLTKRYYWTVDNYRNVEDTYSTVSGATGYMMAIDELKKREPDFKDIVIPESTPLDNISRTILDIKIHDDNTLDVESSLQYIGVYKEIYSPLLLFQTDYLEEDRDDLLTEKEKGKSKRMSNRSSVKKIQEKIEKQKAELSKDKKEAIEDWIKDDFAVKTLKDFEITSYGRFPGDETLEITMEFLSEDYVQKAGPNLIMDIGKLIAGQVELKKEEIEERKKPVELSYARMIENQFRITLPEGYQAQGLDALNIKIDNEYAAFEGQAAQDGAILTIKTVKIYKKSNVPTAEWSSLVDMLEAAYQFSQKKIILKK